MYHHRHSINVVLIYQVLLKPVGTSFKPVLVWYLSFVFLWESANRVFCLFCSFQERLSFGRYVCETKFSAKKIQNQLSNFHLSTKHQCDQICQHFATLVNSLKSWAILRRFIFYLPKFWNYFGKFMFISMAKCWKII